MKKIIVAASLAFAAAVAAAAPACAQNIGVSGSANVGGQLTTYNTSVSGNVSAQGSGNSISAAETDGYGKSFQSGSSVGGSLANLSSTTNIGGLSVGANTSQWSNAQTFGSVDGNSPITVGGSIANGSGSIGKGIGAANIGGTFNQNAIGAGIGVNGNFNVSAVGE